MHVNDACMHAVVPGHVTNTGEMHWEFGLHQLIGSPADHHLHGHRSVAQKVSLRVAGLRASAVAYDNGSKLLSTAWKNEQLTSHSAQSLAQQQPVTPRSC